MNKHIKIIISQDNGKFIKGWYYMKDYPPTYLGGYSYELDSYLKKGKGGTCAICNVPKNNLVCSICLECSSLEKKNKFTFKHQRS